MSTLTINTRMGPIELSADLPDAGYIFVYSSTEGLRFCTLQIPRGMSTEQQCSYINELIRELPFKSELHIHGYYKTYRWSNALPNSKEYTMHWLLSINKLGYYFLVRKKRSAAEDAKPPHVSNLVTRDNLPVDKLFHDTISLSISRRGLEPYLKPKWCV